MTNLSHGRSLDYRVALGGTRNGDLQAYRVHIMQDAGAYPAIGSVLPMFGRIMASGNYALDRVDASGESVVTNTTPSAPIGERSAPRPRSRSNESSTSTPPRSAWTRPSFAAGTSSARTTSRTSPRPAPIWTRVTTRPRSTRCSSRRCRCPSGGASRPDRRSARPLLGIGWAAYVEITNPLSASNSAAVRFGPMAPPAPHRLVGPRPGPLHDLRPARERTHGHSRRQIEVRHGDTDEVKRGGGTGGSRSLQVGGTAIWEATKTVVEQAKEVAADVLEANPADIILDTSAGTFAVTGSPSVAIGWAEVAAQAADANQPLAAENDFQPPAATFPFGVHLSVVDVDRDTGEVRLVRHAACDDAGIIINPTIGDGQVPAAWLAASARP